MTKQNPIVLIGFMGVGKTSVGTFLAKKTKVNFCDTDKMITRMEKATPGEIFATKGEAYFRRQETHILEQALKHPGIISTGGGIVEVKRNISLLRKSQATIVYIYGDLPHIMKRLLRNQRRPLVEKSTTREFYQLWERRDQMYRSIADVVVDSTNKRNNIVAAEVKLGVALLERNELTRKEIEDSSRIMALEKEIEHLRAKKLNLESHLINQRFISVIKRGSKRSR
ncbi:shikimate kinase [Xylocopilactobacillus apicola]|uniref:Shikimate kinase n=1 Tax=Xylocopilactobacillus apicola TaxID=2932184 RepID=A0AAU9CZT4_9LACO|nr:shikimate kinase [Xylocopilactobacillus apicola]BDR59542.1 hypothetical protein XA3_19830 [Xylocopilactobacillus apicola]